MSPLPEFAQPATMANDAVASTHRRNTPRFGGFDFDKNARSRILCLHYSEQNARWTPSVLRSLLVGFVVVSHVGLATTSLSSHVPRAGPCHTARSMPCWCGERIVE